MTIKIFVMMGAHRENSCDSSTFSFAPERLIVVRVTRHP